MATVSFNRDWTLTAEQAERLAEVLDKPPSRTISAAQIKKFDDSLKRGKLLLQQIYFENNLNTTLMGVFFY